MPSPCTLETTRLVLRAARTEDAAILFKTLGDPEVMKWNGFVHKQKSDTQDWIDTMVASSCNGSTDFVVCLRPGAIPGRRASSRLPPRPIGTMGLDYEPGSNEIGFLLEQSCWGVGLATEALTAMLDHLFALKRTKKRPSIKKGANAHLMLSANERKSSWMYPSISAEPFAKNKACIALLKKVGFVRTGIDKKVVKVDGVRQNSMYFRLERKMWLARRAAGGDS